jgi:predicted glycosyl hydrolase (DUF1957 family)
MKKEEEIIAFLDQKVFDPVLDSATASNNLKSGIRLTRGRMLQRDAVGMVHYFWSAIVGTERSIGFAAKMKKEGFTRFEEVLEEFRVKFDNEWLAKP